jgi:O-antigen ligase
LIVVVNIASVSIDIVPSFVADRFNTFSRLENDKSFAIRVLMVQKGILLFEDNPIAGVGVGQFVSSSADLDLPSLLRYGSQATFNNRSAHNSYVGLLAETGLLGFVPFACLLLLLLTRGLHAATSVAVRSDAWRIAAFAALTGMSAHLYVVVGITGTATWAVYGLVAGAHVSRILRAKKSQVVASAAAVS